MVTTTCMGGIGNVLFQSAMIYAYSLKHGVEYCIPLQNSNPHYPDQKPFIFPGLNYCDNPPDLPLYLEKDFTYNELPYMDNVEFLGYWQSWKYIEPYRNEILRAFGFDDIETKEGVCSLHYRSGDYNLYPTIHPKITLDYIKAAITHVWFAGYSKFIVFSDAIDEIEEIIKSVSLFNSLEFEYSEGRTELEDLRLMASCAANVTANSSMSWWASYINPNPNKIVIMPKIWFGKDLSHDTKDLYIPGTIVL